MLMLKNKKKFQQNNINKLRPNVKFSGLSLGILVCLFILFSSIGYAVFNTELNISGEATFRPKADIRITDFKLINTTNGASELYNSQYSKNKVITGITLPNLDSTITYEVTVTNFVNIPMLLDEINKINFNNEEIEYDINGISIGSVIPDINTKVFKITFKYKSSVTSIPSNQNLDSTIEFVFIQHDIIPPVISEVSLPKTFYISQTDNIDLSKYATATDDVDGNITDKIKITSSEEFNKNKPGTYVITYNVKDKAGNAAVPLKITIVIWNFTKAESGSYHTLALTSHGKVWAWGYNAEGQIGKGSSGNAPTPVLLDLKDVVDISANLYQSYAVTNDGKIYSWGYGAGGRLGNGSASNKNSPGLITMPSGVSFNQVSAGEDSVSAITTNGEVYGWGTNSYGSLGDGTTTTRNTPVKINGLSNMIFVSQGSYAGAGIDKNGDLYTWGSDATYSLLGNSANSGTTNTPSLYSGLTNMKYVYVSYYHVIAISNSGQVYTWGQGTNGKLGNGNANTLATPYATSITNGKQCSGRAYHSLVTTTNGQLYVFGQNAYGKLGLGNVTTYSTPQLNNNDVFTSNNVGNVKWASAMLDSSIILTEDNITKNNIFYGMGYNGSYQFGTGAIGDRNVPTSWQFTPPPAE